METDDLAPKDDTVKCLTAKVTYSRCRKWKFSFGLSLRLIQTSTIPLKLSTNSDFHVLDVTVVIITGENRKKQQTVAMLSTSYMI